MKSPKALISLALSLAIMTSVAIAQSSMVDPAGTTKKLSVPDSNRLKRYLDTVNSVSLFSQKYQVYFDSVVAICPWRAAWWQQKAMPLFKMKKYELGARYLDSAVKYNPQRYLDYRAFMKCIFQKHYTSAIGDFRAAKTILGPGAVMDHTYDFYIGLSYLQLNNLDSAQFYLNQSIATQKKDHGDEWVHFLDWFYMGMVYYEKEDYAKAIEMFDKSLHLYARFSDVKYYKSFCLARLHQREAALSLIREAYVDFKDGYTINEDNALYEAYPYQIVKPLYYTSNIKSLEQGE